MKIKLLFAFIAVSISLNAQTLTSVTPDTANAGETLQVTITGNNTEFTSISGASDISFYNNANTYFVATAMDVISDTEVNVMITIPNSASTGFYTLDVFQMWDYLTLPNALYITNHNNTITGNITVDVNNNGCDDSDLNMSGIKVMINNGSANSYTFTNTDGDYIFYVPAGEYTVTPAPDIANFTASPASATIEFGTSGSLTEIQDFCLQPEGEHNDLSISILPIGPARPGFDATYRIAYENNGNQTLDGTIIFNFDDSRLDYVSSSEVPSSQLPDNLEWNFTSLLPFESRIINVTLNVNSPMETPAVNIDDILSFVVTINPVSGDESPDDNIANFDQIVVGSYDPNDKAVTEGAEISIDDIDNYLHYLIRFQNTGTFAAENVRVLDMLSDNLDSSTLEIISASHPYRSTLTAGNKLEFFFDNINLPPEEEDEPGSNGFVAFRIKPMNTVGLGSVIDNTAEIYFDFNFPIITNTVSTTVTLLSTGSYNFDHDVRIHPNPAGDVLNIATSSSSQITSVDIYNQLGQLVKSLNGLNQNLSEMEVGELQTGTYYLRIISDKGISTKKLLKL